jgi:hypothetical protein
MIFTVHVPRDAYDPVVAADRARFIRDGFSWGAFLLGPVWFLWQRAILGAVLSLALLVAVVALRKFVGISPAATLMLQLLVSLFFGFEGTAIVRRAIDRRRFRCVDVVSGANREEAEHLFLRRWSTRPGGLTHRPLASGMAHNPGSFGLFGEDGG